MDLNNAPVIDWELGEKLAGNKRAIAEELLQLLVNSIPEEFSTIKHCYKMKNHSMLLRYVHKLHGAVCYCGVPRLKKILSQIEIALKNNIIESSPSLFTQLETEVNLLLEQYSLWAKAG